jgi:hypothetical protein
MKQYGNYVVCTVEPNTEAGKAEYIKRAVAGMLDGFLEHGFLVDWNTLTLVVREGVEPVETEEELLPPTWRMTIGLKFYGEREEEHDNGSDCRDPEQDQ